jgi:hypothetical protein
MLYLSNKEKKQEKTCWSKTYAIFIVQKSKKQNQSNTPIIAQIFYQHHG